MSIEISCPSCRRTLRVPDELIDQSAKCPACGTEWIAAAPSPQSDSITLLEPGPAPDAIRESVAGSIRTTDDHLRESPTDIDQIAPAPPPPSSDDDDEDDDQFEHDLALRHRRRVGTRDVAATKQKLIGPAIGILVASGMILLLALFNLAVGAFMTYQVAASPRIFGPSIAIPGLYLVQFVWYVAKGVIMLLGGLQLLKMRRFGWSMAGCIAAIAPSCDFCFLIGLPFGIWGLVVLLQPDVKRAFQYRPVARITPNDNSDDIAED